MLSRLMIYAASAAALSLYSRIDSMELDYYESSVTGPTRIDGGGPWNFKPVRRHRKFKSRQRKGSRAYG